jgi:hypothetical protein
MTFGSSTSLAVPRSTPCFFLFVRLFAKSTRIESPPVHTVYYDWSEGEYEMNFPRHRRWSHTELSNARALTAFGVPFQTTLRQLQKKIN